MSKEAIARKMKSAQPTADADEAIHNAIKALDDPNLPHDIRMKAAKPLMLAKHFSMKGLEIPAHRLKDEE